MAISTKSTADTATSTDVETGYKADYIDEISDTSNKGNSDTTYDLDNVNGKYCDNNSEIGNNDDDSIPQCLICFERFVDGQHTVPTKYTIDIVSWNGY